MKSRIGILRPVLRVGGDTQDNYEWKAHAPAPCAIRMLTEQEQEVEQVVEGSPENIEVQSDRNMETPCVYSFEE